ncbi:13847_t:CDS:2, partial [Dentiscutata erythropus]
QPDTPIPANLTVPSGNCFKFLLYGCGVQIYQCVTNGSSGSWSLVGPNAYLINDKKTEKFTPKYEVAHHYYQQTRGTTYSNGTLYRSNYDTEYCSIIVDRFGVSFKFR